MYRKSNSQYFYLNFLFFCDNTKNTRNNNIIMKIYTFKLMLDKNEIVI